MELGKYLGQFVASLKGAVKVVQTPYNPDYYAFVREGKSKICNIISVENDLLLFTTGCIFGNDNFDNCIENQTFGAGKLMIERYKMEQREDKEVLKLRHKDDLGKAILKWAEKKGFAETTPLVRQVELTKGKSYDEIRDAMLKDMMAAPPVLCKMGIGRGVIYDLIKDPWIHGCTGDMCVFLARRAFMMENLHIATAFCFMDWYLFQLEMSKDDDVWAFEMKPPSENEGPLCHIKYPANYLIDCTAAYGLKTAALSRKLGLVNGKVASALMCGEGVVLTDEQKASVQFLIEIGWVDWLAKESYGGDHSKVIGDLILPKQIRDGIMSSTVEDVRCFLALLVAELA